MLVSIGGWKPAPVLAYFAGIVLYVTLYGSPSMPLSGSTALVQMGRGSLDA